VEHSDDESNNAICESTVELFPTRW
jgi:hypothetical protein